MAAFDRILRGGILVSSQEMAQGDIGVKDGRIAAIGQVEGSAPEEVSIQGLAVFSGIIDTQVHFREPGLEHKEDIESGSRAAILGGVTGFLEMPNTNPATTTPEAHADKLRRAEGRAWANFGFFMGASPETAERLDEWEKLPGCPGVKIFMGSSTGSLLVEQDDDVRRVLKHGRRPCPVHSEDEERLRQRKSLISASPHAREHPYLRDAEAARLCTERLLALCEETGRPVHVLHISTHEELPMLWEAKRRGLPVTCEVTPQHLTLNQEDYERIGTLAQMNPPVRGEETRQALWRALKDGLFDVMGSDHAPHTLEEKSKPYPASPSGMPGVQTMLPLMLDWCARGELGLPDLARLLAEAPARLYGIQNKGRLAEGMDADLTLVDPAAVWTIEADWLASKCGWSPFEGRQVTGRVEHVMLGGEWAVRDRALNGGPKGRMLEFRSPYDA
jgi:dihydroorotase